MTAKAGDYGVPALMRGCPTNGSGKGPSVEGLVLTQSGVRPTGLRGKRDVKLGSPTSQGPAIQPHCRTTVLRRRSGVASAQDPRAPGVLRLRVLTPPELDRHGDPPLVGNPLDLVPRVGGRLPMDRDVEVRPIENAPMPRITDFPTYPAHSGGAPPLLHKRHSVRNSSGYSAFWQDKIVVLHPAEVRERHLRLASPQTNTQ